MIDLILEKQCEFTAQERYDIISSAIFDAYDDGFMNSFICERALYCYIYATLNKSTVEERDEEFITIHMNPLVYWTDHLDEFETMLNEHEESISIVAEEANTWFADYTEYAYSMRGMLDNLGDIMNGVTQRAEDELATMQSNGSLQGVIDIAQQWGLDRSTPKAMSDNTQNIVDGTSLFNQ